MLYNTQFLLLTILISSSSSSLTTITDSSFNNITDRKSIVVNSNIALTPNRLKGANSDGTLDIDTLRIIRSHATSIYLQCPLQSRLNNEVISIHQIRWVDEINDFMKPDSGVIVSGHNLITSAQINLRLNELITYVSCGKYEFLFQEIFVKYYWTFLVWLIRSEFQQHRFTQKYA